MKEKKTGLIFATSLLVVLVAVAALLLLGADLNRSILGVVFTASFLMTVGVTFGTLYIGKYFRSKMGYFYLGGSLFKFFGYLVIFFSFKIESDVEKKHFLISVLSSYVVCQLFSVFLILKQLKKK